MNKATLTISNITDRENGWGMKIIEVTSDRNIKVINRGYNEFEALNEIDESDLLRLREILKPVSSETVHLEIKTPERLTHCWYPLQSTYLGGDKNHSLLMW